MLISQNSTDARPPDGVEWIVYLPDDDPEAFGILVNIIHAKLDQLPDILMLHKFYNVCVLADKYLLLPFLRKLVPRWYDCMWWSFDRPKGQISPIEVLERTSTAYIMGDCKALWAGLTYYAYACRLIDNKLILCRVYPDGPDSSERTQSEVAELSEAMVLVCEEMPSLPAVFIGRISAPQNICLRCGTGHKC